MKPWEELQQAMAAQPSPATEPQTGSPGPWADYAAGEAPEPRLEERLATVGHDFMTDMIGTGLETYFGLKQMFGAMTPRDEERLTEVRQMMEETTGAGPFGEITGAVLQMAVPGSAALKGASALTRAVGAGTAASRAAPLAAGAATAGLYGAAQPVEEEGAEGLRARLARGARDAAISVPLGWAGGKLIEGVRKVPEAIGILRRGGYLTPGMAAESKFLQNLESIMEVTPFIARGTKAAREAAQVSWNKQALNAARPPGMPEIDEVGNVGFRMLKEQYKRAYDDAWGLATQPGIKGVPLSMARREGPYLSVDAQRALNQVVAKMRKARTPRAVDEAIRRGLQGSEAKKSTELVALLQGMRTGYRASLGRGVQEALKTVDDQYGSYVAVRRAVRNSARNEGVFTPEQLAGAAVTKGGETRAATGLAPMLPEAVGGIKTVGRKLGGQPLEWFRRAAGLTPTPLPMRLTGQYLIGQGPGQRSAQALAAELRRLGIAPGVPSSAAAIQTTEE